ncbi:MAG: DUF975 family protein [Ruminococcaceae bacterium]|nr:DUF975 family protein [Oscillospiraceae bacterium]
MTRAQIKEQARAQLSYNIFGNSWMTALLVCLIAEALVVAAGTILPGVGAMVVSGPIAFGLAWLFRKQTRDHEVMNIIEVFNGFIMDLGQNFLLGLLSGIFVALWSMLLVVPGIVKAYSYASAYYIKIDNPDYDWRQCLRGSEDMMRGHKAELFLLDLSFIGWYIVGAMCFGIGALWVMAYHHAARSVFYENLKTLAVGSGDYGNAASDNGGWYN